jgi:RNA recognition motif-containing protein
MKLFLGNLSYRANEEEIYDLLREYGNVEYIDLVTDKETGTSKGYAYFKMRTESESKVTMEELNNQFFMGRKIVVNEADNNKNNEYYSQVQINKKKKRPQANSKRYYQEHLE